MAARKLYYLICPKNGSGQTVFFEKDCWVIALSKAQKYSFKAIQDWIEEGNRRHGVYVKLSKYQYLNTIPNHILDIVPVEDIDLYLAEVKLRNR